MGSRYYCVRLLLDYCKSISSPSQYKSDVDIMSVLTTMITIGKEIDCGLCGLAHVCVGGATMGAALQFCVPVPQICFTLKVSLRKR